MKTERQNGLGADTKPQAVILAGGRSSRFGEDKARAKYNNTTMLQELAVSLKNAGFQIVVSTSHKGHQTFGYPIIWDKKPFLGPLYALGNILEALSKPKILVTACDTPLINPALANWLWKISEGFDITILENEFGRPSPLPGIYSSKILPVVGEGIAKHEKSLKSLLRRSLKICTIPAKDWKRIDLNGRSLMNINTKQDLKKVRTSATP